MSDVRAQVAAKRAARVAKQAALETKADEAALLQELADEDAIAKAMDDHGAIGDAIDTLPTSLGVIIVRRPKQAVWRRFSDSGAMKGSDIHTLVRQCLVHPAPAQFDAICEAYPATLELAGGKVATLAQSRTKEAAEK